MADAERRFNLAERHQRFIDQQVASGRHATDSAVVQEALRRYEADLEAAAADQAALRKLAEHGERDVARGAFTVIRDDAHLDEILDRASRCADQLLQDRQRSGRDAA
jgi:putative addiction module CopG family antidote